MMVEIPDGISFFECGRTQSLRHSLNQSKSRRDLYRHSSFLTPHSSFFFIIPTNLSNSTDVSLGPAQASGWNCTEKALYSG